MTRLEGVVTDAVTTPSYSVVDVSRSLGAPTWGALLALGVLVLGLLVACAVRGRRGDDAASFSIACLACLVAAPNVWLHSLAFMLPVVGLARPRFSGVWLVPLILVVVPVVDPSAVEIAIAWLVVAAIGFHLLRAPDRNEGRSTQPSRWASEPQSRYASTAIPSSR